MILKVEMRGGERDFTAVAFGCKGEGPTVARALTDLAEMLNKKREALALSMSSGLSSRGKRELAQLSDMFGFAQDEGEEDDTD